MYAQSDTVLLADVFENFESRCLKSYGLNPAEFLPPPGLACKIRSDIDMLLMVEKVIRREYVTLFTNMQNLIINA